MAVVTVIVAVFAVTAAAAVVPKMELNVLLNLGYSVAVNAASPDAVAAKRTI